MAVERRTTLWGVEINDALVRHLERVLAWAIIATVFFLPISEALKNIFFSVSLTVYLAVVFARRERIVVPPVGWFLLGFLGAGILSAAVSPYPWKAIAGVWDIFRYTSFFFMVERGVREEWHVRTALWLAVSGLGITALVTLFRHFVLGVPRIDALSLGGNESTALYALMGLALMFGLYIHTEATGWQVVWLITVAVLSLMLLGRTHTRMLWAALVLIALIFGWLRSARVAITTVAIFGLIVLGLGAVNPEIRDQIVSLGDIETYKTSFGGEGGARKVLWKKSIAMWRDAPWLGVGPKAFSHHDDVAHNPERTKYPTLEGSPHNVWLQTAVEMGSVGLVILVATFGYIGVWLIRWRERFSSSWPAAVWDGAFGSWLAILMGGITEPSFGRESAMFFFMLVALLHTGVISRKGSAVATEGRGA
jgi:O-antigen ligase